MSLRLRSYRSGHRGQRREGIPIQRRNASDTAHAGTEEEGRDESRQAHHNGAQGKAANATEGPAPRTIGATAPNADTDEVKYEHDEGWTWSGRIDGQRKFHNIDYVCMDDRCHGRLTDRHMARLPGLELDHRWVGQPVQLDATSWNAGERRRRQGPGPL